MAFAQHPGEVAGSAVPELTFGVQDAAPLRHAAVPTIRFALRIDAREQPAIRSVLLDVQIQIAARLRGYARGEEARLLELFGDPREWSTTLRTLPWLRTTMVVPAFEKTTVAELDVPCTYDLEVTAARYFAALAGGVIPLELLFSGSVFFTDTAGALQAARIGWDRDAQFGLPVAVWRETMDRHFPGSGWLRVGAEQLAALAAYKARHAFPDWDATVAALLAATEEHP